MLQHLPHNIYSRHLHEERYKMLHNVTTSPPYWAVERLSAQSYNSNTIIMYVHALLLTLFTL